MKASKETTDDSFHICPKYDKVGSGKQVYRYTECRKVITENIPFRCINVYYTSYYKAQALSMLTEYSYMLKNAARIMHATPKQMKDFNKEYLETISGDLKPTYYPRYIAINEFLLEHPHRYRTIAIDAESSELIYLEKGKGKDQVEGFIKFVGDDFMSHVQAVAMYMNNTYCTAIHECLILAYAIMRTILLNGIRIRSLVL